MKKLLSILSLSFTVLAISISNVLAQAAPADNSTGSVFGTINPPAGVDKYNAASGGNIGLIVFISNLIRVATVAAGIWVMINFVTAGWMYISSSGNTKNHSEATGRMTSSIIGLAIIVGSYTIAAIIGLVLFGDASFIINPRFEGVGTV